MNPCSFALVTIVKYGPYCLFLVYFSFILKTYTYYSIKMNEKTNKYICQPVVCFIIARVYLYRAFYLAEIKKISVKNEDKVGIMPLSIKKKYEIFL